jgi:hypothetical protein
MISQQSVVESRERMKINVDPKINPEKDDI